MSNVAVVADGLRERNKQATREALSWATIRLVVAHGYAAVRIEDIADAAGVSVRTFRNYFSSKAEAIIARHLDRVRLIAEELRVRPVDEPLWTAVTVAVEARFAMGMDPSPHTPSRDRLAGLRLMISEPALTGEMQRTHAVATAEFAAAVAERTGTDPRDLYPNLVAAVFGAALTVSIEQFLRADPPVPYPALLRDVFAQVAHGLPAPPPTAKETDHE